MIKKLTLLTLFVGLTASSWGALKLETTAWLGAGASVDTNGANGLQGSAEGGGAFLIERARLDIKGEISKDLLGNSISGRFTADLTAAPVVRYAYFDYQFARELTVSAGVLPVQFGNINYLYQPLHILPDSSERFFTLTPGTDLGILVSGKLFAQTSETETTTNKWDLVTYSAGIVNGEGHKELFTVLSKNADNYAGFAHLALTPHPGLTASASIRYQAASYSASNVFLAAHDLGYNALISAQGLFGQPLEFLVEYSGRTYSPSQSSASNVSTYAAGIQLGYGLLEKLITPYVRYDFYDKNSDSGATNDNGQVIDLGITLRPAKTGFVLYTAASYWLSKNGSAAAGTIDYKVRLEYKSSFNL